MPSELTAKFDTLAIPEDEREAVQALARQYYASVGEHRAKSSEKNNDAVFPSIGMNIHGVRTEFNLAKNRKPVAKIIEQMVKSELVSSLDTMLGHEDTSEVHWHLQKDSVLGRYIPVSEKKKHLKNHEIQESSMQLRKIYSVVDTFFAAQEQPTDTSIEGVTQWANNVIAGDSFTTFLATLPDSPSESAVPIDIVSECSAGIQNHAFRKYFENRLIHDRINDKDWAGVPQILSEMRDGKRSTTFTEAEIGSLFDYFNENVSIERVVRGSGNEEEAARMLCAVNALDTPSSKNLAGYFTPKLEGEREAGKVSIRPSLKERIGERLRQINFIRRALSEKVSDLLVTIGAKPDKNIVALAGRLVAACYPAEWSAYKIARRNEGNERSHDADASGTYGGLTQDRFESRVGGGNVGGEEMQERFKIKLAEFNTPVSGMFVTNIVGYDPDVGIWKRKYVPVDGDALQDRPTRKVSASRIGGIGRIIPTPFGAQNIQVEGSLRSHVSQDGLGLSHLEGSNDISGWAYEIPEGSTVPREIDDATYTRYLSRFVSENGALYLEKNPELPLECRMFVDGIQQLPPHERAKKIQDFVTESFFYDSYDNPLRNAMNAASFADRCSLMQERLEVLRQEVGSAVPETTLFAGVCSDAAIMGESMLREAGLPAAVIEGYSLDAQTELTMGDAHAISGVFWPDQNGRTVLHGIDMTPPALTDSQRKAYEQQGIRPRPLSIEKAPSLEGEVGKEQLLEEEIQLLEDELESILHSKEELGENDDTSARIFSPEQQKIVSEKTVALRGKIAEYIQRVATLEDVAVLKGTLEAVRYSPVLKTEQTDTLDQKIAGMQFVQSEYKRLSEEYGARETQLERISHLGKNFLGDLDAMVLSAYGQKESDAFIRYIGAIGEYGGRSLPETHAKIWKVLKTYMKARVS